MKTQKFATSALCLGLITLMSPLMSVAADPSLPKNPAPAPAPTTREIQIGVNEAFIPAGFDSGSDAYVVASGLFRNGCYSWSRAEVKNVSATEHEITTFANVNPPPCIMAFIPYQKEIRLGKLATGTHTVRFLSDDSTYLEKTFEIE